MAFSRVLLDASVTLEWFVADKPGTATYADDVLHAIVNREILPLVPDLWHYGVGSVLIAAKRARRITALRLKKALEVLSKLRPFTINTRQTASEVVEQAAAFYLQGYDAVYFDLAKRLNVPIATSDGGMRTACRAHGVKLWKKQNVLQG